MDTTRSTPDLWELASALYLHGPNVDTLHAILPSWTKSDIQIVLRRFKGKAERERLMLQGSLDDSHTAGPLKKKFKSELSDSNFSLTGPSAAASVTKSDRDVGDENAGDNDNKTTSNTGFSNNSSLNLTNTLSSSSTTTTRTASGAFTNKTATRGSTTAGVRSGSRRMAAGGGLLSWTELVRQVHAVQGTSGNRSSKLAPIKDHSQLLSKVMLYSACFEDHYHGGSPDDTCYSEIYRYLSQLLAGEEPTQLRARSAAKVLQLLDGLRAILETGGLSDRQRVLRELSLKGLADGAQDAGAATATKSRMKDTGSRASLFGDPEESSGQFVDLEGAESNPGEACAALDPRHPYFQERRAAVNDRLMAMQESTAASLTHLPGLNPLGIPPALLTKPLAAFPSSYPARVHSEQSETQ